MPELVELKDGCTPAPLSRWQRVYLMTCGGHAEANISNRGHDAVAACERVLRSAAYATSFDAWCSMPWHKITEKIEVDVGVIMGKGRVAEGGARLMVRESAKFTTTLAGLKNNRVGLDYHDWGLVEKGVANVTRGQKRFMGNRHGIYGENSAGVLRIWDVNHTASFHNYLADYQAQTGNT